jgi:hypothetical protein
MMSTAVMVGEINATDWAKSDGNPRALVRSPNFLFMVSVEGASGTMLTMSRLLVSGPHG